MFRLEDTEISVWVKFLFWSITTQGSWKQKKGIVDDTVWLKLDFTFFYNLIIFSSFSFSLLIWSTYSINKKICIVIGVWIKTYLIEEELLKLNVFANILKFLKISFVLLNKSCVSTVALSYHVLKMMFTCAYGRYYTDHH